MKSDGAAAGGTVTATLNGGASLQPASGKVKADAKYGYTGPEKKNETASIDFESRSKRGVGKASLAFDTKSGRPYSMEGGAGDFHGVGTGVRSGTAVHGGRWRQHGEFRAEFA